MNDELIDSLRIDRSQTNTPDRSGAVWWLVALIVVVAVLAAALWWWLQPGVVEVESARVELVEAGGAATVASVLDASGYVVARRQATVAAEVTGKLLEVNVEEGRRVTEGDVLARLDDATERAQLELSEARLGAARSALDEISVQLENARRTLSRQRDLKARDLTSQSDVDLAVTEVDALSARLASQREQVRVAEREVAVQQQRIDELTIRAPFSGVIIARAAQAGEMVSPISAGGGFTRTGICTIVDMDSLEIEVDVNEAYIDRVSAGQPVVARLDAYPELDIPARVKAVVPAADRQKATVRVRVEFIERDSRVLPEMGISVRFLEARDAPLDDRSSPADGAQRLPAIPADAVFRRDGRDYVWRIEGGRVERRAIQLAAYKGDRVIVTAGLAAGDRVVADPGGLELETGSDVRVSDN